MSVSHCNFKKILIHFILHCICIRISAILSSVGVVVFFINSHKVEIRFVQGITRTYEVRLRNLFPEKKPFLVYKVLLYLT